MELKLKYFLIIILLSTTSMLNSKDETINNKSVKEMFKDRNPSLKFEYNSFFNFSVGDRVSNEYVNRIIKKIRK